MNAQTTNKVNGKMQDPPPAHDHFNLHADDILPLPNTSSSSTLSAARHISEDTLSLSDVDIADPLQAATHEMEGLSKGHSRRRSSLINGAVGGRNKQSSGKTTRGGNRDGIEEDDERKNSSDDGYSSDISSRSTSEELELDYMASEDGLDGEETGLTKEDRRKKRRRRRRRTRLNERIAGDGRGSSEGKSLADQSVLRRSLINALLIGLWYASAVQMLESDTNSYLKVLFLALDIDCKYTALAHLTFVHSDFRSSTIRGCSRQDI